MKIDQEAHKHYLKHGQDTLKKLKSALLLAEAQDKKHQILNQPQTIKNPTKNQKQKAKTRG
ncbi:hypothetical protein [Methanonatronarchaeum sp. AMET-Sl]|uniref:hypothetical protein n=1 Tax=Methanonatronarchaeum sp. AMET-Sl TaxID=3037654 RepID=UPI00244DC76A|nr:hypothetical protein [Methanonatronarchaeum sp. AMET-Sl]WGI17895.1 hypothetical protein QEN48_02495 [Methanonatronarchaeum sp. AMET-Sl]